MPYVIRTAGMLEFGPGTRGFESLIGRTALTLVVSAHRQALDKLENAGAAIAFQDRGSSIINAAATTLHKKLYTTSPSAIAEHPEFAGEEACG